LRDSFVVASNSGSASTSTSKPLQIIKIKKPAPGETEIYHASFTGTVKKYGRLDARDIESDDQAILIFLGLVG